MHERLNKKAPKGKSFCRIQVATRWIFAAKNSNRAAGRKFCLRLPPAFSEFFRSETKDGDLIGFGDVESFISVKVYTLQLFCCINTIFFPVFLPCSGITLIILPEYFWTLVFFWVGATDTPLHFTPGNVLNVHVILK